MSRLTNDKRMLEYGIMQLYSNIFCFSTTRHGGVSEGNYASFNCTEYTGDQPDKVKVNQALLQSLFPFEGEPVIPFQTHSTCILQIDRKYGSATAQERRQMLQGVDALITNCPGYCLCISTADCVPLLLYDVRLRVIAAVHAGWRGTAARIAEQVLQQMSTAFGTRGEDVMACIGPSISMEAFETGEEVYEAFSGNGFNMQQIARRWSDSGKWHIDLWKANRQQLLRFGIPAAQIEVASICTYNQYQEFFSARRMGVHSGRILSGILLKHEE